jgi:hypothetical protein
MNDAAPHARHTDGNSNIVIIYNNVIDIIYNSFDSNA